MIKFNQQCKLAKNQSQNSSKNHSETRQGEPRWNLGCTSSNTFFKHRCGTWSCCTQSQLFLKAFWWGRLMTWTGTSWRSSIIMSNKNMHHPWHVFQLSSPGPPTDSHPEQSTYAKRINSLRLKSALTEWHVNIATWLCWDASIRSGQRYLDPLLLQVRIFIQDNRITFYFITYFDSLGVYNTG